MKTSPRAPNKARLPSGEISKLLTLLLRSFKPPRPVSKSSSMRTVTFSSFFGRQVEFPDEAAILEDDGLVALRGKLDVELFELRDLLGRLGLEIVRPEVEALVVVAVGEEIDLVAGPHRE